MVCGVDDDFVCINFRQVQHNILIQIKTFFLNYTTIGSKLLYRNKLNIIVLTNVLSTASVSYHVCSGFLTKCMLFSGYMELSDVTDSHLQQFRKFPRQTLVKTRGCLCQMKAALLSLLLKHSQDQALQTEGRTVSTRRRARLLEVAAVTGCKLASDKLRLVTYSFVAQVSL